MSKANPFPVLMHAFFYEWLVEQRNASIHTVRSYRDTWRLFLRFVAQRTGRKVAMITMTDLTASEVSAFLSYAEHERGGTIGTRNCRLAAIRSFFHFVATRDPASIAQCVEILNIPVKRAPVSEPCYLDPAEVTAILAQPDGHVRQGGVISMVAWVHRQAALAVMCRGWFSSSIPGWASSVKPSICM